MASRWFIELIAKRNPIFAGNLARTGLLRIIPAAAAMYLLIPVHFLLHLALILSNSILCPLLGIEKVRLRNYIIIDRHRLPGLSYTGRFHCIYCGYSNGLCVAFAVLNSHLDKVSGAIDGKRRYPAALVYLPVWLSAVLSMSMITLFYNVAIAPSLGLHTLKMGQAYKVMDENRFGYGFSIFGRTGYLSLRYLQASTLVLANALEQIESQWCPIKHLDHKGALFPDHHRFFVERCELCELKRILSCEGSVSPRKPRY